MGQPGRRKPRNDVEVEKKARGNWFPVGGAAGGPHGGVSATVQGMHGEPGHRIKRKSGKSGCEVLDGRAFLGV